MFDAIVLAGGAAARLGGVDKPALEIGASSLLERVLASVAGAGRIVVVGPVRPVTVPVMWCRENPAGGGPVAGLAAGLDRVEAEVVLSFAADLPWIAPAVPALLAALARSVADCAALVDRDGRVNYLAAVWRRASLARALCAVGEPAGASMRSLVADAALLEVPDEGGWGLDCDTWDDIDGARRRLHREGTAMTNPLASWVAELAAELGVDSSVVDRALLLDVARDAAHGVARPAAPLTTFLVGLAAGLNGGSVEAVEEAAAIAQRLALARTPPG